ncbi:MAG: nitroreductase family protein [Deltaproteobacteria bacterium]|jgi:nitroreductase|nr:nitroreductase family protein [Deltaproteobacteria bacterium]
MSAVLTAIKERRSVREFTREPVSPADLNLLLEAGSFAPTGGNAQAWHITAVTKPEKIAELDRVLKAAVRARGSDSLKDYVGAPNYSINFRHAPLFIVVGVHRERAACPREDGALILGNILLAAHDLGLGACWVNQLGDGIDDEPGLRALLSSLGFPPEYSVIGCAAVGHRRGPNPKAFPRERGQINIV